MPAGTLTPSRFRDVLGTFPTGVVVVTGGEPFQPTGLCCNSFTSVSLRPPLIAVCPAFTSTSWPAIRETKRFCVNVLAADQRQIASRFARPGADGVNKFDGVEWRPGPVSGAPVLAGATAWMECELDREIEAGDHWIALGLVVAMDAQPGRSPLLFHRGDFHHGVGLGEPVSPAHSAHNPPLDSARPTSGAIVA